MEIVHGQMMIVEVMTAEVTKVVAMGEAAAETAMGAAGAARYGVDLSQRDCEQNGRGNGDAFS